MSGSVTGSVVVGGGGTALPYGYSIAVNTPALPEGNSGTTDFTFTITRFGDLSGTTSINYYTGPTGNSPVNGADFVGGAYPYGTATFAPGQTTVVITIPVAGDLTAETDEQFQVGLDGSASNTTATFPPDFSTTAVATILNDDATVSATYSLGYGTGGSLGPVSFYENPGVPVYFTITRSGDISQAGSVDYTFAGTGANPVTGADFSSGVLPSGTVYFQPGQSSINIQIPLINDYVTEPTEGFAIVLSNPSAGTGIDVGSMQGTLLDANNPPGFAIYTNTASVVEGQPGDVTPYSFTIARAGDISAAASVNWSVGFGYVIGAPWPASPSEFVGGVYPSGTATFAPGQATQTITVNIAGNLGYTPNESFPVNLSNPSAGTPIIVGTAYGVIVNDDPQIPPTTISIAATDAVKLEGNSGTTAFTFTITRSGDLTYPGSVSWQAGTGNIPTAQAATYSDFLGNAYPSGTVDFAAGQASQVITIYVVGDLLPEPDQSFNVWLTKIPEGSAVSATAGQATGTILNDDILSQPTSYSIAALDATKFEGNSGSTPFTFVITRSGDSSLPGSVYWAVSQVPGAGSGTVDLADFASGSDVFPSGTATFAPGQTSQVITIMVAGDTLAEMNEQFIVALFSPSYGSTIATGSAIGTILNDDLDYVGTAGNDAISFASATTAKILDLSQGGNDAVTGGSGNDIFYFGGALNSLDKVNGGAGIDTVVLNGDYSAGLALSATTLTNVEQITLAAGNSYSITTNDATVAAGATLTIDATALASINSATINGAAEKNGSFIFLGGAGADVFTGGAKTDIFVGGAGADKLTGGPGADIFRYLRASDSPLQTSGGSIVLTADDLLVNFQSSVDKIDLSAFGLTGSEASVINRNVSSYPSNLNNGTSFFGSAGVVVDYGPNKTAQVFVDVNKDGNLDSGDMLIQLSGVAKGSLSGANFTF